MLFSLHFTIEKVWLKPYVDLQPYDDPSRGVLEFTKELDISCVTMENVIGEGELLVTPPIFLLPHSVILLPVPEFICDLLPLVVLRGVWGGLSWVPTAPRERTCCGCHQDPEVDIFRLTMVELSARGNNYGAIQSPEHCASGRSCHQK